MNNQPKLTSRDKTLCKSGGGLIINPIYDYNILKHKYIKIYIQLTCSTLKHVKIKLSNAKLTATKTKNRYKVGYSSNRFSHKTAARNLLVSANKTIKRENKTRLPNVQLPTEMRNKTRP